MTKKKLTKTNLIEENIKLNQSINFIKIEDERIRKEFAKAFGESIYKSWEEIFVEVGKLISDRIQLRNDETIKELQLELEELRKDVWTKS